jgi:hypothetical protein
MTLEMTITTVAPDYQKDNGLPLGQGQHKTLHVKRKSSFFAFLTDIKIEKEMEGTEEKEGNNTKREGKNRGS